MTDAMTLTVTDNDSDRHNDTDSDYNRDSVTDSDYTETAKPTF